MISASEIEGAVAALKKLDKNGDGRITRDELRPDRPDRRSRPEGRPEARTRRGPNDRPGPPGGDPGRGPDGRPDRDGRGSPERFIEQVMNLDKDGDNRVSRDEASERLLQRFDRIDTDGNGFVEKSELEEIANRIGRRGGQGRSGRGRPDGERPQRQRPPADDTDA